MTSARLYLCRHGDTKWSPVRRLAGSRTDLDITADGEATARRAGDRLRGLGVTFTRVVSSNLLRARRTAELAGFPATIDPRLREMDFGDLEGKTLAEIRVDRPGFTYLGDGCPGGETAADLGARADAVLADLASVDGHVLIFAHSVMIRVMSARYLGLPPERGRNFFVAPGAIAILGWDPVDDAPAIQAWGLT
nr:histidine phosphatase family protein [Kofleriaceae bacterium]